MKYMNVSEEYGDALEITIEIYLDQAEKFGCDVDRDAMTIDGELICEHDGAIWIGCIMVADTDTDTQTERARLVAARDNARDACRLANDGYLQARVARDNARDVYRLANVACRLANDGYLQANDGCRLANDARDKADNARDKADDAWHKEYNIWKKADDDLREYDMQA